MKKKEIKVKIDKDLFDKVKTYKINIEAFMDTGFRRYVDYVVYKNKLEKHKDDLPVDYLTKGFGKGDLKELEKHLDTEEEKNLDTDAIDIITTGISHSQYERMRSIIDIIKRLRDESPENYAFRSDIISEAEIVGMTSSDAEGALDRLKRNGQIYEPMHGKYRVTEE